MNMMCDECRKFSKIINSQHGPSCSCDVFVVCNHCIDCKKIIPEKGLPKNAFNGPAKCHNCLKNTSANGNENSEKNHDSP